MSIDWSRVNHISEHVIDQLTGAREQTQPFIGRGPILGGLSKYSGDVASRRYSPSVITVEFDIAREKEGAWIEISGRGFRKIRRRESLQSETLETGIVPVDFSTVRVPVGDSLGSRRRLVPLHTWNFRGLDQRSGRRYMIRDPELQISLAAMVERTNNHNRVRLRITNGGPEKNHSILYGYIFELRLNDCHVYIDPSVRVDERDVPHYVETVNATAAINKERNIISLTPFGVWNQDRKITVEGPPFEKAIEQPLPTGIDLTDDLRPHFEYGAKAVSQAMQHIFLNEPNARYYKFQYDLRKSIYPKLVKCWNDNKFRAIVVNAPTATGKTEVNFDAAIVATIVLKRISKIQDLGTVAIISEPIRALTAEQLRRLFEMVAHVNEQIPQEERITLGFYMGTLRGKGIPRRPTDDITIDQLPLSTCPLCGSDLDVEYVKSETRLIPNCSSCNRRFDWVYLTAEETETFIPNILVATLDKLCYEMGGTVRANVHSFFGREYVRCSCGRARAVTGQVVDNKARCKFCNANLEYNPRKSQLSVFIIDEGHSFKGSLGSNAGLFITTALAISKQLTSRATLIISSTATVSNAKVLMKNLSGVGIDEVTVFPNPQDQQEESIYFQTRAAEYQRKFIFSCPGVTNRHAIPMVVLAVKRAWEQVRTESDPERLPQIIFTLRRQEAENLSSYLYQTGLDRSFNIRHVAIHGETQKPIVERVLQGIRNNEFDAVFVTLDLIALGIDIPSILVVHFDGFPSDYAKFVQGYGRSARRRNENGIVFVWLRRTLPAEAYYLEHYRDPFIYERKMLPAVPINRWFPASVRRFVPSVALSLIFARDQRASIYSGGVARRRLTDQAFHAELRNFMDSEVLNDPYYSEDAGIAHQAVMAGIQNLQSHIQGYTGTAEWASELLKEVLPGGIRGESEEVLIEPQGNIRVMMSSRIEQIYRVAGYTEEELGLEEE